MKIAYYLNKGRDKNLYCRISDGTARVTFSLGYNVDPEKFDVKRGVVKWDDQYGLTLDRFKGHLEKMHTEIKKEDKQAKLEELKKTASDYITKEGLEGIQRKFWDDHASDKSYPFYDQFIEAIEGHTGYKRDQLQVSAYDYSMTFTTPEGETFDIENDTSQFDFVDILLKERRYDEIYTMCDFKAWYEVYFGEEILRHNFIPVFLKEWEEFWRSQKDQFSDEEWYKENKAKSWNRFQVFMNCYEPATAYELALNLSDIEFGPLFVLTMIQIFNKDICIQQYLDERYDDVHGWGWETYELSTGSTEDDYIDFKIKPE